jgi:hypothetical protein
MSSGETSLVHRGRSQVQTRSSIPLLVRACMHVPEHVAARPVQEQRSTLLSTEPPLWSDQMKRGLAVGPPLHRAFPVKTEG